MNELLQWHGISRQAAHKMIKAIDKDQIQVLQTVELAAQIRQHHPQMGCRDMHYSMRDQMPRGRDWTEAVLLDHGFRVKARSRSFTNPGQQVCPNRIEGLALQRANQLWQTDITYVWVGQRWYYLSFVVDVYTRRILASHCSKDLSTGGQITCLKKALRGVPEHERAGLIIHSDRGCQYTSNEFKDYLRSHSITQSMAHYAWQNAYCERVNRSIKHGYLKHYPIENYASLTYYVNKAVRQYNDGKPHRGLPSRISPNQFVKERSTGLHSDYSVRIWSKLTSTKFLHSN